MLTRALSVQSRRFPLFISFSPRPTSLWTHRFQSDSASDGKPPQIRSSTPVVNHAHRESGDGTTPKSPPPVMAPMPQLPDPVTKDPTPHITDADLKNYLEPLYTRCWGIAPSHRDRKKVQTLSKTFIFKGFPEAVSFVQDVAAIVQSENHHPILKVEGSRVFFATFTHSGMLPHTSAANLMGNRRVPGLTIRDVRLAILAENLFRDVYIPGGRGKDYIVGMRPPNQRPSSLEKLGSQPSNARVVDSRNDQDPSHKLYCPCCGGPHSLGTCPNRATILPNRPCSFCGQRHWTVDCPRLATRQPNNSSQV